jgi:hypothetical protein
MRESPNVIPPSRQSAAIQQSRQLETWESEGGTTVPVESRRTESARQQPDATRGSQQHCRR